MTVTGKTIAENIADLPPLAEGQDVIYPVSKPVKATGHIAISGHLGPSRVSSGQLGPSWAISGGLG